MPDTDLWIIGISEESTDRSLGTFLFRRAKVSATTLRSNITGFVDALSEAMADVPQALSGYTMESVQVIAEISAKGKLSLLGSGGEAGGKGGIIFTFTRAKPPSDDADRPELPDGHRS
ncbi:hypothetical protein ACBJ59_30330 [Nonomuraea sp. MTCD27]|uniref:Pepco domain-containing protein n=1 Tax=Nonomuraea sp. MTCD27 TaxID=1676747 RepID=UPI0035C0BFD5